MTRLKYKVSWEGGGTTHRKVFKLELTNIYFKAYIWRRDNKLNKKKNIMEKNRVSRTIGTGI